MGPVDKANVVLVKPVGQSVAVVDERYASSFRHRNAFIHPRGLLTCVPDRAEPAFADIVHVFAQSVHELEVTGFRIKGVLGPLLEGRRLAMVLSRENVLESFVTHRNPDRCVV